MLRGADLIIMGDNDDAGGAHVEATAAASVGIAARVRMLDLAKCWEACPEGGDVSDWWALLIAPGGTGKTALRYLQAIELARESMVTITGFKRFQRCKVLIVGLEDGRVEMDRRIAAALLHHRIDRAEIKGHLICWSPRGLKLAEMKGGSRQIGELERRLRGKIKRLGIDLVMVDPLIKAHAMAAAPAPRATPGGWATRSPR
jgi:hypothetical protein